jgi:hypothetical protein
MFYKICSLLAVFVCLYTARLHSQQTSFTISGYITEAKTGESLIGASVFDLKSGKGTIANNYGFYSLTLPADSVRLRFSYVGYQTLVVPLLLKASQKLDIKITGVTELQGVEIIAETSEKNFEKSQMSTMDLSMDKVRALPVLLGERDILKTIQLLPGVQSGTEGSAGLYVRGGGPDQNLILLDGVPVYNANHLFGFFSVFNTDAINSVKLIKGGFPAEYGGRLSSVIDIHMKEGNNQKFHGEGGIGLIASRLTLEGPIVKDKTSFIVSGRRTYVDVLARPFIRSQGDVDGGYFFYDLNTKINHKFSDRSRLFLSGYFGRDKFFAKDSYSTGEGNNWNSFEEQFESGLDWGNAIGAARWNYIFNPRLFSNTTLTYSQYKFKVFNEVETRRVVEGVPSEEYARVYYDSGIRDWSVKSDFSFVPNPNHYIKFGGAYMYHTFNPGVNQFTDKITGAERDTTYGSEEILAHEFYTYIDDDFVLSEKLKINAGLHFSGFFVNDVSYFSLQPRFSGRYLIDRRTSIKASYAHMAQYLHLLTNAGIGLPTDLWVPPTENIKPQLAHQVAAGVSRGISEMYEFTFEAYYKTMQNLIEYQDGASFLGNASDWQNKVETGKGWSYGGEFMLEKKKGKTTGWIGYTLSWSNRQFENLNFGRTFPYKYDRRHDISVVVTHKFSDRVDVGLVWVYGTGNAVTLPFERYRSMPGFSDGFGNGEIGHIESRNNYRMAAYHRLDLGVNLHRKTKWGESTWNFGLYNAYSRQNPFFLYFTYDSRGNQRLTQFSLFPIIPSVTYNFKF